MLVHLNARAVTHSKLLAVSRGTPSNVVVFQPLGSSVVEIQMYIPPQSSLESRPNAVKLIHALQQFYRSTNARFKSATQCRALDAIVKREESCLVVLPTGGGKSLLFMLPAYMEPESVTVVIVPLKVLLHGYSIGKFNW